LQSSHSTFKAKTSHLQQRFAPHIWDVLNVMSDYSHINTKSSPAERCISRINIHTIGTHQNDGCCDHWQPFLNKQNGRLQMSNRYIVVVH